jgi:hypothetical protein
MVASPGFALEGHAVSLPLVESLLHLCMMSQAALLPPVPLDSGWHLLRERALYVDELGRRFPQARAFYWEAPLGLWRDHALGLAAYTPRELACDAFEYVAATADPDAAALTRRERARAAPEAGPVPLVFDDCDH